MRSLLIKLIRSPRIIATRLYDLMLVPLWIRFIGVQYGRGCRFTGLPVVRLVPGARINLGSNLLINSRFDSNPRGVPHPTVLAALTPHSYIEIGNDTGMAGASIVARQGITIGKRVLIGPGACIWDNDGHPLDPDQRRERIRDSRCAPIKIEDDVFIGARALILKGVNIGRGAVVGAGAVVINDVKPGHIVFGNPARVVGWVNLRKEEESHELREKTHLMHDSF